MPIIKIIVWSENGERVLTVDSESLSVISGHSVYLSGDGNYACISKRDSKRYLHRAIMMAKANQRVDHINGDTMDNRIANLRFADATQNLANSKKRTGPLTSVYKGVCYDKSRGKWMCRISSKNKRVTQKRFENEIDAAKEYNRLAVEYFGDFAKLNEV